MRNVSRGHAVRRAGVRDAASASLRAGRSFARHATAAAVDAFRQEPKRWLLRAPKADDAGRLWILTSRDHDEFSYLEFFVDAAYAGTVRVADRAVGFDVLGATLAVLVQRPLASGDPDGVEDRMVLWYDISGLPG